MNPGWHAFQGLHAEILIWCECWLSPAAVLSASHLLHCSLTVSHLTDSRCTMKQSNIGFCSFTFSGFTFFFFFSFVFPFWERRTDSHGLLFRSSCRDHSIQLFFFFPRVMPLFEGYSMVLFKKAVLWFWMDNLVAHFTIRLSFRASSDLCHMGNE